MYCYTVDNVACAMCDRVLTLLISVAAGMMDLHSVPYCIPICLRAFLTTIWVHMTRFRFSLYFVVCCISRSVYRVVWMTDQQNNVFGGTLNLTQPTVWCVRKYHSQSCKGSDKGVLGTLKTMYKHMLSTVTPTLARRSAIIDAQVMTGNPDQPIA